ncbi:MAG: DUF309 domain-containing protein [Haloechinothrix sp.]
MAGQPRTQRGRDRDEQGRARNARPRDGLGRPLPYGATGVERQPEGVERAPQDTVAEAQRLLDEGKPFHAHEVFEDAWKSADKPEHALWKGLAQLAVGLTHAARGNAVGGASLLRRGATNIAPYATRSPYDIDIAGLCGWAEQLATALDAGGTVSSAAARSPRLR